MKRTNSEAYEQSSLDRRPRVSCRGPRRVAPENMAELSTVRMADNDGEERTKRCKIT